MTRDLAAAFDALSRAAMTPWPAERFLFRAEDVDDRDQVLNVERIEVVAGSLEEAAAVMAESFPGWQVQAVTERRMAR